MDTEILALKSKIEFLEGIIREKNDAERGQYRDKIEEMSSEVTDSNPYSRLMALKRMGIVDNYETIRDFSVIIVGLGGIGR